MQHEPESDISAQLADHLSGVASAAPPSADWSDLTDRITASHRRRQRFLAGTAVVAALATGAAGFGLGHSGRDSVTMTSEVAGREKGGSSAAAAAQPAAGASAYPVPSPVTSDSMTSSAMPTSMKRLIARRTDGGLEIRSWKQDYPPYSDSAGLGILPPECITTGSVSVAAVTDTDLTQNGSSITAVSGPQVSILSSPLMGGDKHVLFVTVINADAAQYEMRTPDGGTDRMAPQDGVAILGVAVADLRNAGDTTITSIGADGSRSQVQPSATLIYDPARMMVPDGPDCSLRLPVAGEQPADPAAARALISEAFNRLNDPATPIAERISLLDDSTGVAEGYTSSEQSGQIVDRVFKDLVFTAADTAVVEFEVRMQLTSDAAWDNTMTDFGQARLIDGRWVITRDTICRAMNCNGNPSFSFPYGPPNSPNSPMPPSTTGPAPAPVERAPAPAPK